MRVTKAQVQRIIRDPSQGHVPGSDDDKNHSELTEVNKRRKRPARDMEEETSEGKDDNGGEGTSQTPTSERLRIPPRVSRTCL